MKLILFSLFVLFLNVNGKPYSKVIKEVQDWGVIPQGLLADDTDNIHLEDFYRPESLDFRSNVKKSVRNLNLGLALPPNTSRISADEFYEQTIANLKVEMPQLRWIKFHDGYTYFPENGTQEQLENELIFLKQHIQRVMRVLHGNGIDIEEQSQFHVNMLFPRETIMKSNFRELMREEYEYTVKDEEITNDCMIKMRPKLGNIQLSIELNFVDRLSPFIRSEYPQNYSMRHVTAEAITQGRISSRIAGVLLSTFMGSPMPFLQCRI